MNIDLFNNDILVYIATFTPLILAIVQLVKITFKTPRRYAPIISVVIGILLAYAFAPITSETYRILMGLLSGLSAAGLWSGVKAVKNS